MGEGLRARGLTIHHEVGQQAHPRGGMGMQVDASPAHVLLDGLDFHVAPGELVSISASSGVGKTTLLRALARLIPLGGGMLSLEGVPAHEVAAVEWRRRVAYVPQAPVPTEGGKAPGADSMGAPRGSKGSSTVAEEIAQGPWFSGRTLSRGAIAQLADEVGLMTALLDRPATELSGGERQRMGLARALANAPSFLLLDEPTAGLDSAAAAHLLDAVAARTARGVGTVLVTHIAHHAARIATRRLALRMGRLEEEPASEEPVSSTDDRAPEGRAR